MFAEQKTLADAFYETLKDVNWAEKHSVKACEKSAKEAKSPTLKAAFENHAVESANQVERLVQIFDLMGKSPDTKTCEATRGILKEMEEDIGDFGDTEAGDDVLIGCAQALEHYEIARYGMLHAWATRLGMPEVAQLLADTLAEEKAADEKLSQIAGSFPALEIAA